MSRLEVLKTYKLYIGGQFPRTESGRYNQLKVKSGSINYCLASRKDFRNAVVAARNAQVGWQSKTAFNRSQILYRIGEMLEGRKQLFVDELVQLGLSATKALEDVEQSIDLVIYFAGWCDKYQQVFSCVNPVAASYFNFSVLEPMGVVGAILPNSKLLSDLVSTILPIIAGGNTCVILASEANPLSAISFAEVLSTSDLSGGVVNILTGSKEELIDQFGGHMDVNACLLNDSSDKEIKKVQTQAVENLKRIVVWDKESDKLSPYLIQDFQEVKTTWHPVEQEGGTSSSY